MRREFGRQRGAYTASGAPAASGIMLVLVRVDIPKHVMTGDLHDQPLIAAHCAQPHGSCLHTDGMHTQARPPSHDPEIRVGRVHR